MKFQALGDKIYVKEVILKEKKLDSGIILTADTNAKSKPQKMGIVESFGDEINYSLNIGDVIVFHQNGGMCMIENNQLYRILTANEIYGKYIKEKDEEIITEEINLI